jgi:hypothetical protein
MSLKHFHLFFIACSEALMGFLARWSFAQRAAGLPDSGGAIVAIAGAVAGLAYLSWFVRHYRTLS